MGGNHGNGTHRGEKGAVVILTDGCHVVSDRSLGELYAFANRVGLRAEWFQWRRIPHYDILGDEIAQRVIEHGEVEVVKIRELVKRAVRWAETKRE